MNGLLVFLPRPRENDGSDCVGENIGNIFADGSILRDGNMSNIFENKWSGATFVSVMRGYLFRNINSYFKYFDPDGSYI